jgi:integrase
MKDPKTRGLYVQVARGGTKSFVYRRYVNGTWRQKHLGVFPEMKIEQARTEAYKLSESFGKGSNPIDEAMTQKQEQTFGDLFAIYASRHMSKKKTPDDTAKNFDRWLSPLAKRCPSTITFAEIDKLHKTIALERGEYAANRAVQLGRAILYKAKQWKLFSGDNHFSGISLVPEHPRNRFMTDEEAGKLLKALTIKPASHDDARTLRDFLLICLFTGARKSNVASMRFDELDLNGGTWSIPGPKTKNSEAQVIPLGAIEVEMLKERRDLLKRAGIVSPFAIAHGATPTLITLISPS